MSIIKTIYGKLLELRTFIKATMLRRLLGSCGTNFRIDGNCRISSPEKIRIGNNVSIENNCSLYGQGGISLGNNVMIASYVHIVSADHRHDSSPKPIRDQGNVGSPIVIEDDVWIGINVVILRGVTIGKGSVVGAGSVVVKDIPPGSIAVGNPARVVKTRKVEK